MSYTTGEIAALCGVTVRAVQFYDREGLLKPDGLSEGGRRLYGDESVKTLQIICTYKSLGLSLSEIKRVTSEKDGGAQALLVLLENKEKELGDKLDAIVSQRDNVRVFKERLKSGLAAPSQALCDVRKNYGKQKEVSGGDSFNVGPDGVGVMRGNRVYRAVDSQGLVVEIGRAHV